MTKRWKREELEKEGKEGMKVKCRNRRLWCPCREKEGRRKGRREGDRVRGKGGRDRRGVGTQNWPLMESKH